VKFKDSERDCDFILKKLLESSGSVKKVFFLTVPTNGIKLAGQLYFIYYIAKV
jgi:hypothetical protein